MKDFMPYLGNTLAPPVNNSPVVPYNGVASNAASAAQRARVLASKAQWRQSGLPNADLGAFSGRRPMQEIPMDRPPITPWWSNPMQAPRPAVHPGGYQSNIVGSPMPDPLRTPGIAPATQQPPRTPMSPPINYFGPNIGDGMQKPPYIR